MDYLLQTHDPALQPVDFEPARVRAPRRISRIALVGNYLPRRCGIATFTADVYNAITARYPGIAVNIWAMNDGATAYHYPDCVTGTIEQDDPIAYRIAAGQINASGADMAWIQHEFGIFGGEAGSHILKLIERLQMPVAVTLHTVLAEPLPEQRRIMDVLVERCQTLIVMAHAARRMLVEIYGAKPEQICLIPHGIPDRPFAPTTKMKSNFGWTGRDVILTFGLLSPGKGIETMIAAMPQLLRRCPNAFYVVLGATHPHCVARDGESYRAQLQQQADALGVGAHVAWIDGFCETEKLLDYLSAADVYVTPYLNPAQVTSGTLAYAVGLGKPVVSTPYVHAQELLGGGTGRLVDFGDSGGFANAIADILEDEVGMMDLRKKSYAAGRTMIWPRLAEAAVARFEADMPRGQYAPKPIKPPSIPGQLPFDAILRQGDATGILQHSRYSVPDRHHGYCIDDNARALILTCVVPGIEPSLRDRQMAIYASFIDHAWNPETGRFRNFMSFDRRWLEDTGSNDSNGRALWALGVAAAKAPFAGIWQWAQSLFGEAIDHLAVIDSPRAKAFKILGSISIQSSLPDHPVLQSHIAEWADVIASLYRSVRRPGWEWFEPVLAYDNPRLSEALIRASIVLRREDLLQIGLETLNWLNVTQTSEAGHFSAIGSDSFNRPFAHPLPHDQQPVEAAAMVDACDAAFLATGDDVWRARAINAYRWFLGKNEGDVPIGDVETGACYDALTPTGVNRNQGAESLLAFHLATVAIQRHMARGC
jgi:glycosyltransferase involved in cell wall biosynthesis